MVVFGLFLSVAAAAALWQESSPYISGSGTVTDRMRNIINGTRELGMATKTQQGLLKDCQASIGTFAEAYLTPDDRGVLRQNCLNAAKTIVAATPASSYSWALLAYLSGREGDFKARDDALIMSEATGPSELWIADLRIKIAEMSLDKLSDDGRKAYDADLRLMVQGRVGLASIAKRYVDDPAFRERITGIVETLPPQNQAWFVQNVRSAVAQKGATQ